MVMTLHTRTWGTGGRTAVLLHGMLGSGDSWWAVAPALADRGYRVIAVDLPGHGLSPRDAASTLGSWADAVVASVPGRPALAMGHSVGGTVLAAALDRLRPERAVYVDAPFTSSRRADTLDGLLAEYSADRQARNAENLRARPHYTEQDVAVEALAAGRFDPATAASVSFTGRGVDVTPSYATRTLLVLADGDASAVPQATVDAARARGATVSVVPGAQHSVWFGHVPQFLAVLDAWLAGPGRGTTGGA